MRDRCEICLRPVATQADWDDIPEGEGTHLCWQEDSHCPDDRRTERIAELEAELATARSLMCEHAQARGFAEGVLTNAVGLLERISWSKGVPVDLCDEVDRFLERVRTSSTERTGKLAQGDSGE